MHADTLICRTSRSRLYKVVHGGQDCLDRSPIILGILQPAGRGFPAV